MSSNFNWSPSHCPCRYILVDWLVEVTTMKDFSSLTLHVTVGCVDRYLALRSVPKARLQLLGIACMVVCTRWEFCILWNIQVEIWLYIDFEIMHQIWSSQGFWVGHPIMPIKMLHFYIFNDNVWFCFVFLSRYISKEILTIREAVWLTDNTYKYEDLVRMMGEVVSVLEGKIRVSRRNSPPWQHMCFMMPNHLWENPSTEFEHLPMVTLCASPLEPHAAGLWGSAAVSASFGEADHSPV